MIRLFLLAFCLSLALAVGPPGKLSRESGDGSSDFKEGDMKKSESGTESSDRNMINGDRFRWPKGPSGFIEVPYVIDQSLPAEAREIVKQVVKDYARWTCVKWVERTNQQDYVSIGSIGHCWSMVGRQGGKQDLSLGPGCFQNKGTPTHELMHALGFHHEQSRSDRDRYIEILTQNIASDMKDQFEICKDCTLPNFAYDVNSVMHYDSYFGSRDGRSETMRPRDSSKVLGQRGGMNRMDMKKIGQMYNCNGRTVESNQGYTVPADEVYDIYTNCWELTAWCKEPSRTDIAEKCKKSCAEKEKGGGGGGVDAGDRPNYDIWNNCRDLKHRCAHPYNNYSYIKNCGITCKSANPGDYYDEYNNCPDLKNSGSCSNPEYNNKLCGYTCHGNRYR